MSSTSRAMHIRTMLLPSLCNAVWRDTSWPSSTTARIFKEKEMNDLLTYEQAAELLHCSKKNLERAMQLGDLEAYRPGKRILFKRADLLRWLDSRQVQPRVRRSRSRRRPIVVNGGIR